VIPNSPSNLTALVLRGFAFVGGQTVVGKLIAVASQYILSWLLLPADFGLVGLAYTVSALAGVGTQIGLREFIIRRQRSDLWIEPALWVAVSLSTLSAILMCVVANLAASIYHEPRVAGLVLVLALAQPFSALNVVLSAVLQKRFRFAELATIGTLTTLLSAVLSIVFAKLGLGAYSFVAPVSLVGAVQLMVLWRRCGHRIQWRPRPRIWRNFVSTGAYVFLTGVFMTLGSQGDYILLGLFHSASEVGFYFFAYSSSVQISGFLWVGFTSVLFPLMSSIQDDAPRLSKAFQRAVGTIAVLIVPLCFLQAALAEPVIRLLFAPKWVAAVPLIQLLSIGIGLHTIANPCVPLLQAQGRFGDLLKYTSVWTLLFLPCIYLAAKYGNALMVASAVAVFYAIGSPVYFFFVVRKVGVSVRDVISIYFPSACASLLSGTGAVWVCSMLGLGPAISLVVTIAVFLVCYIALISTFAPVMSRDAVRLLTSQPKKRLTSVPLQGPDQGSR
jgi:O-antigen/teichoic acid export membrane protein